MAENPAFYTLDGPLAPTPGLRQTRATHLQGFAELLRSGGVNPVSLLEQHEIDPRAMINRDAYIGCEQLMEAIEHSSHMLGAPLFSLDLARRQTQVLGFVGSLCAVAPDLAKAIDCLIEYLPVMHSPECKMSLKMGPTVSELHCGSWLEHSGLEQINYGAMLNLLDLLGRLTEGAFRPHYVLMKARPGVSEVARLEQEYACKVHTGQPYNAVGFATHMLGTRVASSDGISFRLLRDYADSVRADQRNSLLTRVSDYIRGALAENCNLVRCAATLGTNARKLQLQLDGYGVSFSELLAQQREEMAKAYLTSNILGLDEIAHRLGYADQTSFGRAFRRWTGKSPGTFKTETAPARNQLSTNRLS